MTNNLLSHLEQVKQTGQLQWVSRCPAHGSRGRKLSITETEDGRILLKCWSRGCPPAQIVDAVGLTMVDLFPEHLRYKNQKPLPKGQRWIPRTVLTALSEEISVVWLCAGNMLKERSINQSDFERLGDAVRRTRIVLDEVSYG